MTAVYRREKEIFEIIGDNMYLTRRGVRITYNPIFQVTSRIIKHLGKIEASREIVDNLAMPLTLEGEFRQEASVKMTHYSTKIEGNRLTLKQTNDLLCGKEVIAREIDKREVMNYYNCMEWIINVSRLKEPIHERLMWRISRGTKCNLRCKDRESSLFPARSQGCWSTDEIAD
ncbi:MAG: hypothetical protein HYY56_04105 [Candidatus Omnitrophica bacterium]|nr:hypothetical protein [Candidatus Omnitrophota bacterium]